jgi:hypothetical protein
MLLASFSGCSCCSHTPKKFGGANRSDFQYAGILHRFGTFSRTRSFPFLYLRTSDTTYVYVHIRSRSFSITLLIGSI